MTKAIDGEILLSSLYKGLEELEKIKEDLDRLNLFPVADKDTGRNMCNTLRNTLIACTSRSKNACDALKEISSNMLYNARGSSGNILALFFMGMSQKCKSVTIDSNCLDAMFNEGRNCAYNTISNPTEGTMLTAMKGNGIPVDTIDEYLLNQIHYIEYCFKESWNLLPLLKEHNTLDTGMLGFYSIIIGMYEAISNSVYDDRIDYEVKDINYFNLNEPRYCLEILMEKGFNDDLTCFGNEVILLNDSNNLKIHIHTDYPEKVISLCEKSGRIFEVKKDDMYRQIGIIE